MTRPRDKTDVPTSLLCLRNGCRQLATQQLHFARYTYTSKDRACDEHTAWYKLTVPGTTSRRLR